MHRLLVSTAFITIFILVCSTSFILQNTKLTVIAVTLACLYFDKLLRDLIRAREEQSQSSIERIVKQNYEMSRTLMNLSEQHMLLCEIRTRVTRTLNYSKEALHELQPRRVSDGHIHAKLNMIKQSSADSLPISPTSPKLHHL